jgi:hypothetical protein
MHVEHVNRHALFCPCWQLQTRFARRRSAYKLMPSIGAIVLHISPEAKKRGIFFTLAGIQRNAVNCYERCF